MVSVSRVPVITIDGPSGSGKGTVSQALARRLGWHWLDSGMIYRAIGWAVHDANIDLADGEAICDYLEKVSLQVQPKWVNEQSVCVAYVDGTEVTAELRSEHCGQVASQVAVLAPVRSAVLAMQRQFQQQPGLVADGRDMGSVVFIDANLKIFLTASVEIRAKRRYLQLQEAGVHVSLPEVLCDMQARDVRDQSRSASPLVAAPNAIVIDTAALTVAEVVAQIWALVAVHLPDQSSI